MDEQTKKEVEKISKDILRASNSFDIFPTPVDKIISYSQLILKNNIDVTTVHRDYISESMAVLKRALGKISGLFVREEKHIYLDLSMLEPKKNFVKLHEVGHAVLPWQNKICSILDDDVNLRPDVIEEFEAEANYFASMTLFQHDRFMNEMGKYDLSINSAIQLAKHFGSSIHASLRRYVEYSKKRCALLVLENISLIEMEIKCFLKDKFQSDKFTKAFGDLNLPFELGINWPFVQDYNNNRRFKTDGNFTIMTKNGNVEFDYHFFCNSYNAFIFLFPKGEKKSSRQKVIITNKGVTL